MTDERHIKICEDADGGDNILRVFTDGPWVVLNIVSAQGGRLVKLEPHTAHDVGEHITHIAASAAAQRIVTEIGE
jgi:hypothetical protein